MEIAFVRLKQVPSTPQWSPSATNPHHEQTALPTMHQTEGIVPRNYCRNHKNRPLPRNLKFSLQVVVPIHSLLFRLLCTTLRSQPNSLLLSFGSLPSLFYQPYCKVTQSALLQFRRHLSVSSQLCTTLCVSYESRMTAIFGLLNTWTKKKSLRMLCCHTHGEQTARRSHQEIF